MMHNPEKLPHHNPDLRMDAMPIARDDAAWRGEELYRTCLREVRASVAAAGIKGYIRPYKTYSMGAIATPYGCLDLSVSQPDPDPPIKQHLYFGRLVGADGTERGRCFFSTYKRTRNCGWLCADDILFSMDALSQQACEWAEIILADDDALIEETFNQTGLLTADEIWIAPELRNSNAWKVVYFATMAAVFAHQKRAYEDFVFKPHPLMDEAERKTLSKADLAQQAKDLRRLYAVHLDARTIWNNGNPTDRMRAWVPDGFFEHWERP